MDGLDGEQAATAWGDLCDAYGSAEHVPVLLAAADGASASNSAVWGELWGRLCHQGTVSTASYAALPALVDLSRRHGPAGYVPALHLAADIIASTDGPEPPAAVRRRYAAAIATLGTIAARNLDHAADDFELVYGLQALAAFDDVGVWQRNLHVLADGEAQLDCPACGEALLLDLADPPYLVRSFTDQDRPPVAVVATEPLSGTAEHGLLQRVRAASRASLAERLTTLFGVTECPHCRISYVVADALV